MNEAEILSMDITHINDDTIEFHYNITIDNGTFLYMDREEGRYYKFTTDSVYFVNDEDGELMQGAEGERFYDCFYSQKIEQSLEFLEFLTDAHVKYAFNSMRDSVIDGAKFKILSRFCENGFVYNEKTGEYDIPENYNIDYFYNEDSKCLEKIEAIPTEESVMSWNITILLNITYPAETKWTDAIFDFSNPKYKLYSRHNDRFIPYSWSFSSEDIPQTLDSVLYYPMVSMSGDTTCIAQQQGWLLIDFWRFGCRGCYEGMAKLKKEQDSLGYRILNEQGIKILMINAISDNMHRLDSMACRYDLKDCIYSAKGMGELIDIHVMPQYYLVSPQKQIVAATNNLGDYSDLIQRKKSYHAAKQ